MLSILLSSTPPQWFCYGSARMLRCHRQIPLWDYNIVTKIITTPVLCRHWWPTQLMTTRLCKFKQPLKHSHCNEQACVCVCCFLLFLIPVSTRGGQWFTYTDNYTHNIHHLVSAPPLWTKSSGRQDLTLWLQVNFRWCVQSHKLNRNTSKCFTFFERIRWDLHNVTFVEFENVFQITSSRRLSWKSSAPPINVCFVSAFADSVFFAS